MLSNTINFIRVACTRYTGTESDKTKSAHDTKERDFCLCLKHLCLKPQLSLGTFLGVPGGLANLNSLNDHDARCSGHPRRAAARPRAHAAVPLPYGHQDRHCGCASRLRRRQHRG
jgi:hypothetical protein